MSLKNTAIEIIQSPKVAAGTAASTAAMGNFLSWLPDAVLAKVATLLGMVLTLLLIAVQVYKLRAEVEKRRLLDMQIRNEQSKRGKPDDLA